MSKRTLFTKTVAGGIGLCLIVTSMSFVTLTARASVEAPVLETVEDGARQFDEGVREVESILKMDLSTEQGVKQAAAILKRSEKKLAHYEKKALQAALKVEAFKKGLKDEAAKRKGGETELASELESKPGSVGDIPGADEAAEAIRKSTKPAADVLQTVADALQKAGDAAKKKYGQNGHHASKSSLPCPIVETSNQPVNSALFCGSHQPICELLTRLGLRILRQQLEALQSIGRKADCVEDAYFSYGSCVLNNWWDTAYCAARLANRVNICIRYI